MHAAAAAQSTERKKKVLNAQRMVNEDRLQEFCVLLCEVSLKNEKKKVSR